MTAKQRFIAALERRIPDRRPVTTHHLMKYFLDKYMNGMSNDEFSDADSELIMAYADEGRHCLYFLPDS